MRAAATRWGGVERTAFSHRLGQLARELFTRHFRASAIALLVLSEALIVQWALLATGNAPLGAVGFAVAVAGLAAANFLLMLALRRRARSRLPGWLASRVFMLGSLGALLTGPLMLMVFAGLGLPLLVLETLGGPTSTRETALVAGGGIAVALGFGSILWGFVVGQRRIEVERIDLELRDLPTPLAGLRIAQISDLHIGPQLRGRRLRGLIERVNELDVDVVVITGDLFDFDAAFVEEGCRELARLEARHGVFAILGNHDVYTGTEAVADGLRRLTSIRLLRDEWIRLEIGGASLYLLGVEDPGRGWGGRQMESAALERIAREVPEDAPRLVLMHRPSYFPQVVRLGLPVALAGHTHGGQVTLPPPAHQHNISRLVTRWTRGRFEDGASLLYVNRGLGVAGPPVRLNCPREIALLRLLPRG